MEIEIVKRLPFTEPVKRQLYMFSGNKCANPKCKDPELVGEDGYLGNIAHIEAAEELGPRFNPSMTNEDRRAYENLILVCNKCNTRFDNEPEKYTVDILQRIKANHEKKYKHLYDAYLEKVSVYDHTEIGFIKPCKNAGKLYPELNENEQQLTAIEINEDFLKWEEVPRDTREFASIILKRGKPGNSFLGDTSVRILYSHMKGISELSDRKMKDHIEILDACGLGEGIYEQYDDSGLKDYIIVYSTEWNFLEELQNFNKKTGTRMEDYFVEGKIFLLDS